jgi:gamma-glutamylaminecyclotransferase
MTMTTVFVYGTLKHGYSNHRLLESAKFLGNAITKQPHVLLDAGFPVCVIAGDNDKTTYVFGEVYEVDAATLTRLDRLEGEGRMYHRLPVDLVGFEGVQAYFGDPAYWNGARVGSKWLVDMAGTWIFDWGWR